MKTMNSLFEIKRVVVKDRVKFLFLCLIMGLVCSLQVSNANSQKAYSTKSTTQYAKASNPTTPNTGTTASSSQKGNDYQSITFDLLGDYDYTEPLITNGKAPANTPSQIPANVKSLNGKKVVIQGYFYPMDVENGGTIKDFLLLRNQIYCCFGDAVRINEWISVEMSDGKAIKADFTSRPVTLYGTLEVGEKFDNGCLLNLYRMKADKMVEDK